VDPKVVSCGSDARGPRTPGSSRVPPSRRTSVTVCGHLDVRRRRLAPRAHATQASEGGDRFVLSSARVPERARAEGRRGALAVCARPRRRLEGVMVDGASHASQTSVARLDAAFSAATMTASRSSTESSARCGAVQRHDRTHGRMTMTTAAVLLERHGRPMGRMPGLADRFAVGRSPAGGERVASVDVKTRCLYT
jgi:hypothetical protein